MRLANAISLAGQGISRKVRPQLASNERILHVTTSFHKEKISKSRETTVAHVGLPPQLRERRSIKRSSLRKRSLGNDECSTSVTTLEGQLHLVMTSR